LTRYKHDYAAVAFQVHAALLKAEAEDPALSGNRFWTEIKMDAYERFALAFVA
jgi:hypothetical protein